MTGGKFKLPKGYRETIEAARDEARALGLSVSYTLVGKHPKLLISDGEREIVSPFSSTPRVNMQAEFARRKVRSAARRLLQLAEGTEA